MKLFSWLLVLSLFVLACSEVDTNLLHTVSNGRILYEEHCANCHQSDGSGLAKLIPPLNRADYLLKYQHEIPCIIRHGIDSAIKVNEQVYHLKMPSNPQLTDKDIYYITQFVLYNFTDSHAIINDSEVALQLKNCGK